MRRCANPFHFSEKTVAKLKVRGLARALVERALAEPERVLAGTQGRVIYQRRVTAAGGKIHLLMVVDDPAARPPAVVTAFETSKLGKYGGGFT